MTSLLTHGNARTMTGPLTPRESSDYDQSISVARKYHVYLQAEIQKKCKVLTGAFLVTLHQERKRMSSLQVPVAVFLTKFLVLCITDRSK